MLLSCLTLVIKTSKFVKESPGCLIILITPLDRSNEVNLVFEVNMFVGVNIDVVILST